MVTSVGMKQMGLPEGQLGWDMVTLARIRGWTVRVKVWVASGATPLAAVMVKLYVFAAPAVPPSVAVPSRLSVSVAPDGRGEAVIEGIGCPVVVIVKLS